MSVDLIARLRDGVRVAETTEAGGELYDIDGAETTMAEAATLIEGLLSNRSQTTTAQTFSNHAKAARHTFRADDSNPTSCAICGYAATEQLQHFPKAHQQP